MESAMTYDKAILIVLLIITIWSTYMFGYNKGFNEALNTNNINQSRTLQSLQLANDYQQLYLQCISITTDDNTIYTAKGSE